MTIKTQICMVMNLDKCIGCHTCSVTCKQVWTNRPGTEHVWFNNVETKPGLGYPKRYEDQEQWKGGWTLDKKGKLKLKAGGQISKLLNIFWNPNMPTLEDYYDPWTYDYSTLTTAPVGKRDPVATPESQITGKKMQVGWGPNWEDDLAGAPENAGRDPNLEKMEQQVAFEYEQAFMFYLPRICEHCLNPSCVASCPSGAMYKREEDGIVLVDQLKCRAWRFCVSGCPYKKVYFNWQTGKAEKCTFCYPKIEDGMPTVCSETCVGRLRYLGVLLYDADRVEAAASTPDEKDLLGAQLDLFLDPNDPQVQARAARDGIPDDWLAAARRSPVWALVGKYRVALPLHPEYRTLPMVWYVPPLSPVLEAVGGAGYDSDPDDVFPAIDNLRIPVQYLANLLTAGDTDTIRIVLKKLATMRRYMRQKEIGTPVDESQATDVGMTPADLEDMHRLLAIAKYEERYVIPKAHTEYGDRMMVQQGACGLDFNADGTRGNLEAAPERPFGENFMLVEWIDKDLPQQTAPVDGDGGQSVNLLDMVRRRAQPNPEVAG